MSETTQKHSMLARLGRWLAELILVFVGVYAAFWLNNYQQGKEQAKRHDQILAYLEQRLEDGISSADTKTLTVLRQLESTVRGDLSAITHFEKLSDELIAPNLDQDISFFYDPVTKKLRKRFEKYPQALDLVVKLFHDMETTQTDLLRQIQAERQRH